MNALRIGIIGGAGYTGGELLRLLLRHPHAEIVFAHSTSSGSKFLYEAHPDLLGETEARFTSQIPSAFGEIDVLFLCVGHGEAIKFLAANAVPATIRIIDLSQDFRYTRYTHAGQWVYGLPELYKDSIALARSNQQNIANPGCFATCVQLALLPWAKAGLLPQEIHITGVTGSTGAGQSLSQTSHFSWRASNLSVYKAFDHQHVHEIRTSLHALQPSFTDAQHLYFVPMRGSFTRGILASVYGKCSESEHTMRAAYKEYYAEHPFVHVADAEPDVKQVINTNKCVLSLHKHGDILHVVSVIDNLLKGASGQAVQNMNLLFGLDETTGLHLKSSAF
jgi:N-acetyl-gamma-glutamyl-phosphate reductase